MISIIVVRDTGHVIRAGGGRKIMKPTFLIWVPYKFPVPRGPILQLYATSADAAQIYMGNMHRRV